MSFKVYQPFESTDIISGKSNVVSSGFFPAEAITYIPSSLTTSSNQAQAFGSGSAYDYLNGLYYLNVYDNNLSNPQELFAISYGDIDGSGSKAGDVSMHTKAIYTQYKNLLLGLSDSDQMFSFLTGSDSTSGTYVTGSDIFVLNFSYMLKKSQIDPGQWQFSFRTTASTDVTLVDSSVLLPSNQKNQDVYEIIRGYFDPVSGRSVSSGYGYEGIGLFYPKNGIMIFNASVLNTLIGQIDGYNGRSMNLSTYPLYHQKIFKNIVGCVTPIRIRKSETIPSSHYFIRVKNKDFNFSNNPTFIYQTSDGVHSRGDILDSLVANPTTYVTTVGLYNDLNELVAVAKLSNPTRKNSISELLIRTRIDF